MIASFLLVGEQPYAVSMVAALKEVHECPVIQMSDLNTPKVEGVDEIVRIPFKVPLMLYRFKHLANFDHNDMLIVDTDVIAKRPIDDVWRVHFDVALTIREQGELYNGDGADIGGIMPFNTGVMLSRSQAFWRDCYTWLAKQSEEKQKWYGDQEAVAVVAGRKPYEVLILPCSKYNWAPTHSTDNSDAYFWHYKGAIRKKWIPLNYSSVLTSGKQPHITYFASRSSSGPAAP
jgi:hypothetical protein